MRSIRLGATTGWVHPVVRVTPTVPVRKDGAVGENQRVRSGLLRQLFLLAQALAHAVHRSWPNTPQV